MNRQPQSSCEDGHVKAGHGAVICLKTLYFQESQPFTNKKNFAVDVQEIEIMLDCSLRDESELLPQVKKFKSLRDLFTSGGKMG